MIKKEEDGKGKYINPPNGDFIKRLYEKVEAFLAENVYNLTLEDLQVKTPPKTF